MEFVFNLFDTSCYWSADTLISCLTARLSDNLQSLRQIFNNQIINKQLEPSSMQTIINVKVMLQSWMSPASLTLY